MYCSMFVMSNQAVMVGIHALRRSGFKNMSKQLQLKTTKSATQTAFLTVKQISQFHRTERCLRGTSAVHCTVFSMYNTYASLLHGVTHVHCHTQPRTWCNTCSNLVHGGLRVLTVLSGCDQVTNFGDPFLLKVQEDETLADIRPRLRAKLPTGVSDEDFAKYKFNIVIHLRPPHALGDEDVISQLLPKYHGSYGQVFPNLHTHRVMQRQTSICQA
jgi:hypothetical protein